MACLFACRYASPYSFGHDGVRSYRGGQAKQYGMLIGITVNEGLPPWMRSDLACINLNYIWPGPKEPADVQAVNEIVVDELVYSFWHGTVISDASRPGSVPACARSYLLHTINDHPAMTKSHRYAGHGAHAGACYGCAQQGHSIKGVRKSGMYSSRSSAVCGCLAAVFSLHCCACTADSAQPTPFIVVLLLLSVYL